MGKRPLGGRLVRFGEKNQPEAGTVGGDTMQNLGLKRNLLITRVFEQVCLWFVVFLFSVLVHCLF